MIETSAHKDHWRTTFEEKHGEFVASIDQTLAALVGDNRAKKLKAITKATEASDALKNCIAKELRPNWIGRFDSAARNYVANPTDANALGLAKVLQTHWQQMRLWAQVEQSILQVDFDHLLLECIEDSRIDKLFEELIGNLEKIIASNAIDSIAIDRGIRTLTDALRQAATGTPTAKEAVIQLGSRFFRRAALNVLRETSVVGPMLQAAQEIIEEMEQEWCVVKQAWAERSWSTTPGFRAVAGPKEMRLLPSPKTDPEAAPPDSVAW